MGAVVSTDVHVIVAREAGIVAGWTPDTQLAYISALIEVIARFPRNDLNAYAAGISEDEWKCIRQAGIANVRGVFTDAWSDEQKNVAMTQMNAFFAMVFSALEARTAVFTADAAAASSQGPSA